MKTSFTILPFVLLIATVHAQGQQPAAISSQTRPPMDVLIAKSIKITGKDPAVFKLQLQSSHGKAIRAFVVQLETVNQDGTPLGRVCHMMMQPGNKVWSRDVPIDVEVKSQYAEKAGMVLRYVTSIDFVTFADGSTEGLDSCKESEKIRTMWIATDAERRRLTQLRDTEGMQAVDADLNRKNQ